MCHFKLNQVDTARTLLAAGGKLMEKMPKLEKGGLDGNWRDWIIAHALQAEAQQMIDGERASAAPPANPSR